MRNTPVERNRIRLRAEHTSILLRGGGYVYDPWLVNVGAVHLFHLQDARHATSQDCVFWEPDRAILALISVGGKARLRDIQYWGTKN